MSDSGKPFRRLRIIRDHSAHDGRALLVLYALFTFADASGEAWPSVKTLARYARVSLRNAGYALVDLQASGEVTVLRKKGPKGTNLYRIEFAAIEAKPALVDDDEHEPNLQPAA